MAYAGGIYLFMEKLNQLIHCSNNNHHEIIISQRPQLQLLYDDLASIIQTLTSIDQHQDLQKVNDLKQRFRDAAEEAEYTVDLFLSRVHITNNIHLLGDYKRSLSLWEPFKPVFNELLFSLLFLFVFLFLTWDCFCYKVKSAFGTFLSRFHARNSVCFLTRGDLKSLNLDDVRRSLRSLEVEFTSIINMDSSLIQSALVSISTNSQKKSKLSDDENIAVGLESDVELIRDRLVADYPKKLDVVSIVGMGGIGKTTLATKVFNDPFLVYHFHVRVWATVSQTYDKRDVLVQILESVRAQLGLEKASDARLREMVHKSLMGRRYLMVIDDIWDMEAWDDLKLFLPHDNTGSRVLLTSHLTDVASHATSGGFIHHLGSLNQERSWELLCHKVFRGNECPEWSVKPGMQIAENCKGLPLAVVVVAGVLAKKAWNEKFWVEIAYKTGSYIAGDHGNGCLEMLGLSYRHLPLCLRDCFLYLGGFPEDYEFEVKRLVWLWVAEGFIKEDGDRSLEDIAEGYLMDLIDRNLVIVDSRNSNRGVKACKMHDLIKRRCQSLKNH